jgi:hypothetical protein
MAKLTKQIKVLVEPETHREIQQVASSRFPTVAAFVRHCIERELELMRRVEARLYDDPKET